MYNGCTNENPVKCDKSGTCAKTNDECDTIFKATKLPNGCTFENPFKCDLDSSCVNDKTICPTTVCNDPAFPIQCIDKQCVNDVALCK